MDFTKNTTAYYLTMAYSQALGSPDLSTQNGAIILDGHEKIIGAGCNEFTIGVEDTPERQSRMDGIKYLWIEHAERNAIYDAARAGYALEGATMVCPWAACADCARAIVQTGITNLVRHADASARSPERWVQSIALADEILHLGGVTITEYVGHLGATPIRHCEEIWTP